MNTLTGWPCEPDDGQQQANELAQAHYLEMRDEGVLQALALLNQAAVESPRFAVSDVSAALRSVVDAYNEAAQSNLSFTTIILEGIKHHGISKTNV